MAETTSTTEAAKEEPLITAGFQKRTNEENADASKIVSILYGLIIFIGGVSFSISHAIVHGKAGDIIRDLARLYFTYLYWVSIIWMIFCTIDIIRHPRKVKIPASTLDILDSNDTGLTDDAHLARNKLIPASTEANRKASTTSCIDLQVLHESEEDRLDKNEDEQPEMNLNEISTDNKDTLSFHDHRSKSNSLKNLSHQPLATKLPTDMTRGGSIRQRVLRHYLRHRRDNIGQHVIGYNYDDNATVGGLYIRIGIGIFCLGTVIHSGLSILSNLENHSCVRWIAIIDNSSRLLFSFMQFFFIFKNSNLVIRAHASLARLAVIHIVITNLCVWFRMVVVETKSQIDEMEEHSMASARHSSTASHLKNEKGIISTSTLPRRALISHPRCSNLFTSGLPDNTAIYEGYMTLKPILYPCTIEFSLMCLTLFFVIWENIGKRLTHKISEKASTKNVFLVNCHASIKGLFAGLIVFSCTIISVILYVVLRNKDKHVINSKLSSLVDSMHRNRSLSVLASSTTISHQIFDGIVILEIGNLCVLVLSLCATVWSLIKIRKFDYRHTTTRFDDVLIILALSGIYLYSIFSAFAIISNLSSSTWLIYIKLVVIILELIEGTVHALFILVALRKHLKPTSEHKYTAREMITLLIILDLSIWFEKTTTTTKHEANPYQLAFYHVIPWSIIAAIATPLQIFFRFHASVCLSNIWGHMYHLPAYEPVSSSES